MSLSNCKPSLLFNGKLNFCKNEKKVMKYSDYIGYYERIFVTFMLIPKLQMMYKIVLAQLFKLTNIK